MGLLRSALYRSQRHAECRAGANTNTQYWCSARQSCSSLGLALIRLMPRGSVESPGEVKQWHRKVYWPLASTEAWLNDMNMYVLKNVCYILYIFKSHCVGVCVYIIYLYCVRVCVYSHIHTFYSVWFFFYQIDQFNVELTFVEKSGFIFLYIFFIATGILRQSKQLRMHTKSALSIITKSCHSLQFIAISRRSVIKLSAQWISYLHFIVKMREFTSLQNPAPDKNSQFWVVS